VLRNVNGARVWGLIRECPGTVMSRPTIVDSGECAPLGLDGRHGFVALRRLVASTEPNKEFPVSSVPSVHPFLSVEEPARSFGILSTFPPTSCGIATFSAALAAGLIGHGASVDVVRCTPAPDLEDPLVLVSLDSSSSTSIDDAVGVLNATDLAIVQHEYGLYDGPDGDSIVSLMERLVVPVVVVAHTVVSEPTPGQRRVLEEVCRIADVVVVMTQTAHDRLVADFDVERAKVTVIPHGAATPRANPTAGAQRPTSSAPRLLTWGLLGPGKGIEWAIDALDLLADLRPRPSYIVAGTTHPKVREHSGETYREMLVDRAAGSTMRDSVVFDDTYRDLASLTELIQSADLVVLPYDSADQVTSGVLVDAVAAGRPVVSTAFPHAVELLASGAGIVVPQRDPQALAAAIRSVLTDPVRAAAMAAEAVRLAPDLSWAAVARRYIRLADNLINRQPLTQRAS
jgi:glycosyltransferase involved in cell wall biosynthesis